MCTLSEKYPPAFGTHPPEFYRPLSAPSIKPVDTHAMWREGRKVALFATTMSITENRTAPCGLCLNRTVPAYHHQYRIHSCMPTGNIGGPGALVISDDRCETPVVRCLQKLLRAPTATHSSSYLGNLASIPSRPEPAPIWAGPARRGDRALPQSIASDNSNAARGFSYNRTNRYPPCLTLVPSGIKPSSRFQSGQPPRRHI